MEAWLRHRCRGQREQLLPLRVPPVLARSDAAVFPRIRGGPVPDLGFLFPWNGAGLQPGVLRRHPAACDPPGSDHSAHLSRRLGHGHAQQHDQHAGRRLRDLRPGERPSQPHRHAQVRGAQRPAAEPDLVRHGPRRRRGRLPARRTGVQLSRSWPAAVPRSHQPGLPADAGAVPDDHHQRARRQLHRRHAVRRARPENARKHP